MSNGQEPGTTDLSGAELDGMLGESPMSISLEREIRPVIRRPSGAQSAGAPDCTDAVERLWGEVPAAGPEQALLRRGTFRWVDMDYDWRINVRRD